MKNEYQENTYDEIMTKVQTFVPLVTKMAEKVTKIVGLIGATGSGKSTLTSFIQKAPLSYKKVKGGKYQIDHCDASGKYPKIGHLMKSCTSVPAIFQANGQSFVDLTGWFDTGSTNQEIINGFSNATIFKKGKEVKIVIVAQISSIIAMRGGILVDIVQRLSTFFEGDLVMMLNSILLVLSKVNTDDWDVQTATQQIQNIGQLNQNLTRGTKTLIQTLIRNKKIVFFPTPDKITNHVQMIKSQITKMRPTVLTHNGKVSLSPQAANVINSYISVLNGNIAEMGKKIALEIKGKFLNINFKNGQQVNTQLCKLKTADSILKTDIGRASAYENNTKYLQDLKTNLGISINCSQELTKTFTMVAFYKKLNEKINFQSSFIEAISLELIQNIGKLQALRQKMTSEQQRKQMQAQHREQMKKRENQNKELIKKSQQRILAMTKQNEQKIAKQQEQFYARMRQSDAKYAQNLAKMNSELLTAIANSKQPQVIYENDDSGWCQIM